MPETIEYSSPLRKHTNIRYTQSRIHIHAHRLLSMRMYRVRSTFNAWIQNDGFRGAQKIIQPSSFIVDFSLSVDEIYTSMRIHYILLLLHHSKKFYFECLATVIGLCVWYSYLLQFLLLNFKCHSLIGPNSKRECIILLYIPKQSQSLWQPIEYEHFPFFSFSIFSYCLLSFFIPVFSLCLSSIFRY